MQAFVPTKRLKGKSYRDAAQNDLPEKKDETSPQRKATPNPSGLIPEVMISTRPRHKSIPSTATSSGVDSEDDDFAHSRPRRAGSRKVLDFDSDDEEIVEGSMPEESEKETPSGSVKTSSSRKATRKRAQPPPSSDDDDYATAGSPSEDSYDEFLVVSDDERESEKSMSASKSKAKPTKFNQKRASHSESETDRDAMDVDEAGSKSTAKKSVKKRKADDDEKKPAKKQKRREDSDPWKLESKSVQKDWTQMQAPPLEMFHFARKVVDEYTYLDGKILSMVTRVTADRHWVLSGTPPIHDFGALKTIAAFLNLHLGVDDDGEGQSVQVKKRRREQTGVCRHLL